MDEEDCAKKQHLTNVVTDQAVLTGSENPTSSGFVEATEALSEFRS